MWLWVLALAFVTVVIYDLLQKRHAILRSFPIIGHFRYILESIGPELRQYIVTDNDEERPFSRDQRRWVYASRLRGIPAPFSRGALYVLLWEGMKEMFITPTSAGNWPCGSGF